MNLNYNDKIELAKKIKKSGNYFVISLISLISLLFLPLMGSTVGLDIALPDTFGGIMIWISGRLAVATVNIMIFYCFIQQARINVADNEEYKATIKKLNQVQKELKILPRSPKKFMANQWRTKGITLFLASLLSTVFLAQSVIQFDLTQFLTYLFTLTIGVVYGYLTMKNNEAYWVEEFPLYVDMLLEGIIKEEDKKVAKNFPNRGVHPEERKLKDGRIIRSLKALFNEDDDELDDFDDEE